MTATRQSWKRRLLSCLPLQAQLVLQAMRSHRGRHGRWPNLLWPRTACERMQAYKIFCRDPRLPILADKLGVKDYVTTKLGAGWVIPTLWSGKSLPPMAERNWPMPFVIKVNNGCGWNIFVRSPADCDWPAIEAKCAGWMASAYGLKFGEWVYTKMDPRILIEPFISFDKTLPLDYKFWTFHGRVAFIYVITGREGDFCCTLYTRDWQRIAADMSFATNPQPIEPPASLQEMIRAAETLADDLPFVRVDFYEVDGRPLLGEMTFYPGSGLDAFHPHDFDQYVLSLWQRDHRTPPAINPSLLRPA